MKNLIYIFIAVTLVGLSSCKKDEPQPYYQYEEDSNDPKDAVDNYYTNQTDGYTNGGTLPYYAADSSILSGTKWVLVSYKRQGYATTNYPNDTIEFTDNDSYTINGNTVLGGKYVMVKVPNTPAYNLTLQSFISFGSSDDYSGEISDKVVPYGEIYTDFEGQWLSDNRINSAKFKLIP